MSEDRAQAHNVSLEALAALVQRTLEELRAFREDTARNLRRLSGRLTLLERRLPKQGMESVIDAIHDLQGQIDEQAERLSRLEALT